MNEFDQFMRHELKVKYYARYTDDFIVISENKKYLKEIIKPIKKFLYDKLRLKIHSNKVSIRKYRQGIDFLGHIALPYYRKIRKKTWKHILRRMKNRVEMYRQRLISKENLDQTLQSYLGTLSHVDAYRLSCNLKNRYWFWLNKIHDS